MANKHRFSWYRDNKPRAALAQSQWYQNNIEHASAYRKQWHQENLERRAACRKKWEATNADQAKEYRKKWRHENAQWINERQRKWLERNPGKKAIYSKTWNQKNHEWARYYYRNRRLNDPSFRILCSCYERIRAALKAKRATKINKTVQLIGCTSHQLRAHIESQFKPGMHWNNYGKWQIDHVVPCKHFNLLEESEQLKCFHYSNLQPLWAEENRRKSAKLPAHLYSSSKPI